MFFTLVKPITERGARLQMEASYERASVRAAAFGEVGDQRNRLRWREREELPVTLPTPPHESTSTTQFSAAPVRIGIPRVK